ncbi:MAG TPA: hypothetical protein VMP12_12335 [Candidatus Sulfotelmatobacter sp.]|nr:hypothetical protein [Candidatus Sulfotelmatobacter sp.]
MEATTSLTLQVLKIPIVGHGRNISTPSADAPAMGSLAITYSQLENKTDLTDLVQFSYI